MLKLGVNIDHVATLRQARRTDEPNPLWAAVEAELGGADGITFHLREDRRHINDLDAALLRQSVSVKLNMEMAIADDIVGIALGLAPDQCTIVPEKREEITTEGGLDVLRMRDRLGHAVGRLRKAGIRVHAFIEPEPEQIQASADCGFHGVELWTGGYAHARTADDRQACVEKLREGVQKGLSLGLVVDGGHGLTYRNVAAAAAISGFTEFNIGHSIVARAVFIGLKAAVVEMKKLLSLHAPGS